MPLLVVAQLLPSEKAEWPYLVGPSLLLPIVLAIADPTLGGHRIFALGALAGLVLAGFALAVRLRRVPRRSRTASAPAVDATTGYYGRPRLRSAAAPPSWPRPKPPTSRWRSSACASTTSATCTTFAAPRAARRSCAPWRGA